MRHQTGFKVPAGAKVYLHQAFRSCPYAGMVTSRMHDYIEQNGYQLVESPHGAHVLIINTCGSDDEQAQLTFDAIAGAKREGLQVPIIATGCLNSIEPKRVRSALDGIDQHAMLDPRHLDGLDEIFEHDQLRFDDVHPSLHNRYSGTDFADGGWYHVGASTGCLGVCTFCAIRRATGRPKSAPISHVMADVQRGIDGGQHDILFVSTDLSAWGHDLGLSVADLLRAAIDLPVDAIFAGEAFEPTLFLEHFDALLPILASGRFAWIGLPIQSGSQRILDQMKRPHRIDKLLDAVQTLREAAPDLVLRTDILYGFGDETDEDFQASIDASRLFQIPCFNRYQVRPGTAPLLLPDDVVARRRHLASEEMRRRGRTKSRIRHVAPPDGFEGWRDEQLGKLSAGLIGGDLGEGWSTRTARVDHTDERAVIIELVHLDGHGFEVGLRAPDQEGRYSRVTKSHALWVLGRLDSTSKRRALRHVELALDELLSQ